MATSQAVQVTFLGVPRVGERVPIIQNGRQGTSSRIVNVQTHPQYQGWYWVDTETGSRYAGQVDATVNSDGTVMGAPAVQVPPATQAGGGVNVYVNSAPSRVAGGRKNRVTAAILALVLGGIGAHRFYLGQMIGLLYLFFCWTFIPMAVGLIEAIIWFCMTDDDWDRAYNS